MAERWVEGIESQKAEDLSKPETIEVRAVPLTAEQQERVKAMERLANAPDRATYLALQQDIAQQLKMSVRNVQHLMRAWQEQGVSGVIRSERSDRGQHRLDEEWQEFIVKTYRAGNRGGRRMSRAQVSVRVAARAQELGCSEYPSRASVYRVLQSEMDKTAKQQRSRCLGWQGERLLLRTREGLEIEVDRSNQVWQCDHTKLDLFVVDPSGEVLGRPWLTTVVDTHSRCIIGIHLGMEAPSAWVVCLALRHAILPKQYSAAYELTETWCTYGIAQYLYTDGGKEFNSQHLEQVSNELKIVLCQRRYPAEGGIVERPFGTLNTELLSNLPGYTGSNVKQRPKQAQLLARLTLGELEKHLVRYIVDRYNPSPDARNPNQSRTGRWEAGLVSALPLMSERELDICLMRRDQRVVYRGGYLKFANLSYQGEHLAGYAGEAIVIRYNPRDITSLLIYQEISGMDRFLTRAHAIGLESERLAYAEAKAMSRRLRSSGQIISNPSILEEVQRRDQKVNQQCNPRKAAQRTAAVPDKVENLPLVEAEQAQAEQTQTKLPSEEAVEIEVPDVQVWDYEELKRNYGKWW